MTDSGPIAASPRVTVKADAGVAVFIAKATGVGLRRLICTAGLAVGSLLKAVDAFCLVPFCTVDIQESRDTAKCRF